MLIEANANHSQMLIKTRQVLIDSWQPEQRLMLIKG